MKKKIFSLFLLFLFAPVLLTSCKSENEITVAEVTHSILCSILCRSKQRIF